MNYYWIVQSIRFIGIVQFEGNEWFKVGNYANDNTWITGYMLPDSSVQCSL